MSDPTPNASSLSSAARERSGWAGWWRRLRRRRGPALTIAVDLMLMQPGGANGGVKPLVFSFLKEIGRTERGHFRFVFVVAPEVGAELLPLMRAADKVVDAVENVPAFDVLYAPFGRSALMRDDRPTVSLIVDLLHRDLPVALPPEEVNFRHEWFTQIAAKAVSFQCISAYTAARLQLHYGVARERCFVTHLPVHGRFRGAAPQNATSAVSIDGKFFFYPANSWPHKNHETLLLAYQRYAGGSAELPWPLVLTGHPDARMDLLAEKAAQMGLSRHVHFLGHVDDDAFAALWRAAGALVYPSLHEGFGIPLLEAMAFRCPIVASDATSIPEVGGDACIYVDPRDAASIADGLGRVARDEALRRDLVRRGDRRLREFSLKREARKLADRIEEAAATRRSGSGS